MPFIIMWKFGTRQCLLVLNGEVISPIDRWHFGAA